MPCKIREKKLKSPFVEVTVKRPAFYFYIPKERFSHVLVQVSKIYVFGQKILHNIMELKLKKDSSKL